MLPSHPIPSFCIYHSEILEILRALQTPRMRFPPSLLYLDEWLRLATLRAFLKEDFETWGGGCYRVRIRSGLNSRLGRC